MTTLSLCMIVKNEAATLPRCLKSVASIVDEMIIVDTGSTDDTIAICESFGARVISYQWDQHFANARNFGLQEALGDWILWIDADEELDQQAKTQIKEKISIVSADMILLPLYHYYGKQVPVNTTEKFISHQNRLFRNHIGIQFFNRIHEQAQHTDPNKTIAYERIDVPIHHYGYLQATTDDKQKGERNLQLLEASSKEEPKNPWILYHLASEYYRKKHYERAFEFINLSIVYFLAQSSIPPSLAYRLKYAIMLESDNPGNALSSIEKAIDLYPDYVDLYYCKGCLHYEQKAYEQAIESFTKCLSLGEAHQEYLIQNGVGSFRAQQMLEQCKANLYEAAAKKQAKNS